MTQQASQKPVFPPRIAPYIDVAAYLLDSRAPASTLWLDASLRGRELLVLTRGGQSESRVTAQWKRYFRAAGYTCLVVDSKSGEGFDNVKDYLAEMLAKKEKLAQERGIRNPILRMAALGVPNVGKSSFLNRLVGGKRMRTGDAPGVTKGPQWVRVFGDVEVLDTAGILRDVKALNRRKPCWQLLNLMPWDDGLLEPTLALLLDKLGPSGRTRLAKFYKLPGSCFEGLNPFEAVGAVASSQGKKPGKPGVLEQVGRRMVREFLNGRFGRLSLERPGEDPITSPHFTAPGAEAGGEAPA